MPNGGELAGYISLLIILIGGLMTWRKSRKEADKLVAEATKIALESKQLDLELKKADSAATIKALDAAGDISSHYREMLAGLRRDLDILNDKYTELDKKHDACDKRNDELEQIVNELRHQMRLQDITIAALQQRNDALEKKLNLLGKVS